MLIIDGKPARDIDIETLCVTGMDHGSGLRLTLTKTALTARRVISPTLGGQTFPEGWFDPQEVPLTREDYLGLSDAIHGAGLLEIPWTGEIPLAPGQTADALRCTFDDGAEYVWMGSDRRRLPAVRKIFELLAEKAGVPVPRPAGAPVTPVRSRPMALKTPCCGLEVPVDYGYCPKCGRAIEGVEPAPGDLDLDFTIWNCGRCGAMIPCGSIYCGYCGARTAFGARTSGRLDLEILSGEFTICKVNRIPQKLLRDPFCFVGKTDSELSLVCLTDCAPERTLAREDGWRALRVAGTMEFSLIGILAELSRVLAEAGVSIFAVSTYDTDYLLVKAEKLRAAADALERAGHRVLDPAGRYTI